MTPNKSQIIAVIIGVAGLYLTLGYGGSISDENIKLGFTFGIMTALAYSAYILSLKKNNFESKLDNSPSRISLLSSRPITKKKIAIKPSFTQ